MAVAWLCVGMFAAGWWTGRLDLLAEPRDHLDWLRGPRLLIVCVCLVFAGVLYLDAIPVGSRLVGPTLLELEQP